MIVQLPDGGADCLVFDARTCSFVPDRRYFAHTVPGSGKDVDMLTEQEFEKMVIARCEEFVTRLTEAPLQWYPSFDLDDDTLTYRAVFEGVTYKLRINPPGRAGYTLHAYKHRMADIPLWPSAWKRPQTEKPRESGPSVEPDTLRRWSESLCRSTSDDLAELLSALGISGSLTDLLSGTAAEPPPRGATRLILYRHPTGFVYIEIELSGDSLTRARLDAHFGQSMVLPLMHPGSPYQVAYRVEVPRAPHTCALIASFDKSPAPDSAAHSVMLRRDRQPLPPTGTHP
jgi:hypothetical protein